jgi:hypothetical protein
MPKRKISDCTLMVADTYNYGGAVASLKKCLEKCEFDKVVFFTNIPIDLSKDGITVIQIPSLKGKDGYSHFILKEAYKHITTDFVLVVQHDSWILDETQFDERLYNYDYCGALWLEQDGLANGNGGFSFRSYALMYAVGTDELINATTPEDVALCRVYRRYLEKNYNLKWTPDDMCEQFSFELRCPAKPTFGFHSNFHQPYQKTVVVKRMAALGDVVRVEPVLRYFYDKGYRVVLDTLEQFKLLYINHYFKVHFLNNIDGRLLENATFINLDLSYETEPQENHLVTYFKYAGISKEDSIPYLGKPKLTVGFPLTKDAKLFKKYAVFHTDIRAQGGRNIYGIDWDKIAAFLIVKGYSLIHLGRGEHTPIKGAVEMNCTNENFLCYAVGGADLAIGIDSGITNIAVAFGVPAVVFFAGVKAEVIHYDLTNICAIDKGVCCDTPKCWHLDVGNTKGRECYINEQLPPCANFDTDFTLEKISHFIKDKQ